MNSKPVIDTVKKIPWDKVMKIIKEVSEILGKIVITIKICKELKDNTKKRENN
ncbi:MAG TPA: hypothetical protein PLF50_02575 [Candidatus Cloacimonadota bacterium]|nr:hypothetical protein [Candidatus Cloacimonadota bacterium]